MELVVLLKRTAEVAVDKPLRVTNVIAAQTIAKAPDFALLEVIDTEPTDGALLLRFIWNDLSG